MYKKSLSKLLLIAVSCFALAACHTTKNKNKAGMSPDQVSTSDNGGVQTQGMNDGSSFNEQDLSSASENKLRAPYDQVYYFGFDKDSIAPADIASINAQAKYLLTHANARIRLEGNTDARGSREYNVALGWRRAKAVAQVLRQQGVAKGQLVLISYGKEKPAALGQDESSYKLNRRVNLVYEAK